MPATRPSLPRALLLVVLATAPGAAACRPDADGPDEPPVGGLLVGEVLVTESLTVDRAALYFTVTNRGDEDEEILEVSVEGAAQASLHRSEEVDGVMTMRRVESIVIPAGETVQLRPGGYHVMLEQFSRELKAGDTTAAVVLFREQGLEEVQARVVSYAELDRFFSGRDAGSGEHGRGSTGR